MKKILSFALALAFLFTSVVSVSAEGSSQKEEVVYGMLDLNGSVNKLYVVNIFNGGAITDYGRYSDIRNMTTAEKLNQNGEQITINTKVDKFYYQGTLENKELPWNISIKYFLDNKEVSGSELGGKSGQLKIALSVKPNDKINNTFFNNYALQIALSLDNKLCSNIVAESATIAEAGSKRQLSYTVLPGKGIDTAVTAEVHDFEMDAISINGIKLSLDIPVDSDEFTGQISELTNAIKGIDDGAAGLLNGLDQVSTGMQKYTDGLKAYKDGVGQLSGGASQLNSGATALNNGLSELVKQNDPFINGALAIEQAAFDSANTQLKSMNLGLPVLTPSNYSTVLSAIPNLSAVKKQLDSAVQFTQGLKGYMTGVEQLSKGASELAKGTEDFNSSASLIAASANELYKAAAELNGGIQKLRAGLASYKAGTKQLRAGTSDMSSEIDNKVDDILGSMSGTGDKTVSFVSEKNTNVAAVQFVLKTDSIKKPEISIPAVAAPIELTFWQKLLKLFGLYK